MKLKLTIAALACVGLSAQAAAPPRAMQPASVVLKQTSTEILDSKGKVANTRREANLTMYDGQGNTFTGTMWEYLLMTAKGETKRINTLRFAQNDQGLVGRPLPDHGGMLEGKVIQKGMLDKKVVDGQPIAGSWMVVEWPGTDTSPQYTERRETWYAVGQQNGQVGLRPHHEIITSQFRRERVDYWYFETSRLHPTLFTTDPKARLKMD